MDLWFLGLVIKIPPGLFLFFRIFLGSVFIFYSRLGNLARCFGTIYNIQFVIISHTKHTSQNEKEKNISFEGKHTMRQDSTQQTIYEMTKQTVCMERGEQKHREQKLRYPPSMHTVRSTISTAVSDIYNIMFPISLTLFKRISSSGNKKKKKKNSNIYNSSVTPAH